METYKTRGTCATQIDFEVDEASDTIKSVRFTRGCNGNTQGVAKLVEGMKVDDVISRLAGINCSGRGTSCPDQLAKALQGYKQARAL
ncbi:MAG: TIGR03905 family TSCPD domain-containing protein [Lachnospiraceae bacterium]|nr:TIGR03905 family TSCPD domain-containing protein [Lachnospiraceae bacterium]MBR2275350.1 TIGR03905 family TSCPD domain-containing protein [Lachnospiraceae bacterium]